MRYRYQLEPTPLIDSFLQAPPHNFTAGRMADQTPYFIADYNLLTTLDLPLQKKAMALPFYRWFKKLLTPRTCFIGTTVSEYALMPVAAQPHDWVLQCKNQFGLRYDFLIIKDIPQASPLLSDDDNATAAAAVESVKRKGFIIVEGQALAYVPINFNTIDAYLQNLSKVTRKSLRRKLRSREVLSIDYLQLGDSQFDDEKIVDMFYDLYENVYTQSEIHFDKLTRNFFALLLRNKTSDGIVITYHHGSELIGYNVCFIYNDKFIDKYVGFKYPAAREHNLYFVSWFVNLEYALTYGLKYYVAGWTDPAVKKSLGASFTLTCHAVYIRNPFIRMLLKPFTFLFESDAKIIGPSS